LRRPEHRDEGKQGYDRFAAEAAVHSWRATFSHQRKRIAHAFKEPPSLKTVMRDRDWQDAVWLDAVAPASKETGLAEDTLPDACPWTMEQAGHKPTGARSLLSCARRIPRLLIGP
jgi:hypothetical protein